MALGLVGVKVAKGFMEAPRPYICVMQDCTRTLVLPKPQTLNPEFVSLEEGIVRYVFFFPR